MSEALISFIAAIIGGAITVLYSHRTSRADRKRAAEYLAVRVIMVLEQLADQLFYVSVDDGYTYGGRGQYEADITSKIPDVPVYPADIDWKSIEPKLAFRILGVSRLMDDAGAQVGAASEFASPPEYREVIDVRQAEYGKIALEALLLSDELRSRFKLGPRPAQSFDMRSAITKAISDIEERDRKNAELHAQMMRDLDRKKTE